MLTEVLNREGVHSAALDGQTWPVEYPSTIVPSRTGRKWKWMHKHWCTVLAGECICEPPAEAT